MGSPGGHSVTHRNGSSVSGRAIKYGQPHSTYSILQQHSLRWARLTITPGRGHLPKLSLQLPCWTWAALRNGLPSWAWALNVAVVCLIRQDSTFPKGRSPLVVVAGAVLKGHPMGTCGGFGTRPRFWFVCLWQRLLASRPCTF